MAATRFYLPRTTLSGVTLPANDAWDVAPAISYVMVTAPTGTTVTARGYAGAGSSQRRYRMVRYVSDPLPEQVITGTFKGQIAAYQTGLNLNAALSTRCLIARGSTIVGVLHDGIYAPAVNPASEFSGIDPNAASNRRMPRGVGAVATLSPVGVANGDRLIVEIGLSLMNTSSGSLTAYLYFGDDSGVPDLPENETTLSNANYRPWFEFSQDLFNPPAPPVPKDFKVMVGGSLQDPSLPTGATARYVMVNGVLTQVQ